jgi:hypothetical protein
MTSDNFLVLIGLLAYGYIIWSLHRGTPRLSTPDEIQRFQARCQRIINEMKERNHD